MYGVFLHGIPVDEWDPTGLSFNEAGAASLWLEQLTVLENGGILKKHYCV
ncbi:hypothetical protein EGR_04955 [Echinococcus granulosus]|uniref:Uncharacterized protein n=1 Tax=Echinococcus granulosus TaxID=6210 RepID=W6UFN0_ECHGR|nr:hypothetical protein EGR_04955 [Echinococcus granulosus]EUB60245.1 hypothetical protein EGR_04955 [Echinococcus granulosus]